MRGPQYNVTLDEMMDRTDETQEIVNPQEVARKIRADYLQGLRDHTTRALEDVSKLCWELDRPEKGAQDFLKSVADLISKDFGIGSVSIAVRDPVDGLYRYRVVNGIDEEVITAFKQIAYTKDQVNDTSTYPGHEISSHTKIYLAEEHPYAPGEEFSYRLPGLIGMKRRTLSDSLEADYLDFFFYGPDKDILGWIETSGTRLRKLPDATAIRWIELLAIMVGHALRVKK
jgi:hypothetical protein